MSDGVSSGSGSRKRFGLVQLIPLSAALMAGVFIWIGLSKYGFWNATKGPESGFFPIVMATALLLVSAISFFQSFSEKKPVLPSVNWLAPMSVVLIMGASLLIGMMPSLGLYVVLWMRYFEKYNWRTTLITTVSIMSIVIGCFVLWLGVPFPQGLIYETITG